jgi:hypothetical protein
MAMARLLLQDIICDNVHQLPVTAVSTAVRRNPRSKRVSLEVVSIRTVRVRLTSLEGTMPDEVEVSVYAGLLHVKVVRQVPRRIEQ